MARTAGQIKARGPDRWLVSVYLHRNADGKKIYQSETVRGGRKTAEKRLRAAESTAAVVDVDPNGEPCTVEGWTADMIGDDMPEILDGLLGRIGRAADSNAVRAGICEYLEDEREHAAKHAAKA